MTFFPLLIALAGLQTTPGIEPAPGPLEQSVIEFTLASGWRFLLVPRPGVPSVTFETSIDVGSLDDADGERGLANLFANLTLQGSERLGSKDWSEERVALAIVEENHRRWRGLQKSDPDQAEAAEKAFIEARARARELSSPESFRRLVEDAGGAPSLQVECTPDWTRYAVSLPSNQISLWCWLEAERFTRPCLRGFFGERDRWTDLRRRDLEAAPRKTLRDQLRLAAFTTHPYRHPSTGYVDDLTNLQRADADDFFREHYGAARMVTTIVGDFQAETLRPLIERTFGGVPQNTGAVRSTSNSTAEPQPTLERRIAVAYAAPTLMALAWTVPPYAHSDSAAIEVAARLLGAAPGSRLHLRLVRRNALATDLRLQTGWPGERADHLVLVEFMPLAGVEPAAIERAIDAELADLREHGPSDEELAAAKGRLIDERDRALEDPVQLARLLNHYQHLTGDWRDAFHHEERWMAVSSDEVREVIATYFTNVRRTIATMQSNEHPAPIAPPAEVEVAR